MKITYEIVLDEENLASREVSRAATVAELLDFMGMLLRREVAGGEVVTAVGKGCGVPTGHTLICVGIEP